MKTFRILQVAVCAALVFASSVARAQSGAVSPAVERMRVLWIGAHPDDEVTKFIPWLARGRHVQTAYLSLTRGDGGQNLIGNELYEQLGVVRTQELLAARRIDGAEQWFGREYDFGFSKTAEEAFSHWPRDSVLNDLVTVIRAFRPHIIVTTFSGTPRDGHGQHQVSALVARDAYELAGDSVRFPSARFGQPWRPLKLYRYGGFGPASNNGTIAVNVGEYNRHLGLSYSEIGADSRSQHKSQGEGQLRRKGMEWLKLERLDSRVPAPVDPRAEKSIFEGIDTTRVLVQDSRVAPADTFPAVALDAVASRREVALGDSVRVAMAVYNRGTVPVTIWPASAGPSIALAPDSGYKWTEWYYGRDITQPWWLTKPRVGDLFGTPVLRHSENEEERRAWSGLRMQFAGQAPTVLNAPYVYHYADSAKGDIQIPLVVSPGISLTLDNAIEVARANVSLDRLLRVTVRSALSDTADVAVSITVPQGLVADSSVRTIRMAPESQRELSFRLRGKLARGSHDLSVSATANGRKYETGYVAIEYPHITPQRLYRPSHLMINAVEVNLPSRTNVAYIHGVGDNVAPFLSQLGVPLTMIDPEDLPSTGLSRYTAIVVGPRAYQASEALRDNNDYLMSYVKRGGRLVVQYGRSEMLKPGIMPYPITRKPTPERVTDERAPVKFIDPLSPLLNLPNKITQADFEGWVQERATYMPNTFDARYTPLFEMNDPGEAPNRAAVLSAQVGKGTYIYVPLALWRQLPAAVPGAARIFANLLGAK